MEKRQYSTEWEVLVWQLEAKWSLQEDTSFHNLISDRFHADSMICLFDSVLSQRPRNFESEQKLRQLGFVTPRHFELLCLKKHDMRI